MDGRAVLGSKLSQCKKMRIEETFGWLKTVAGMNKSRFISQAKPRSPPTCCGGAAAYNMPRIAKLQTAESAAWSPRNRVKNRSPAHSMGIKWILGIMS